VWPKTHESMDRWILSYLPGLGLGFGFFPPFPPFFPPHGIIMLPFLIGLSTGFRPESLPFQSQLKGPVARPCWGQQ
jgi:hypothetical protein